MYKTTTKVNRDKQLEIWFKYRSGNYHIKELSKEYGVCSATIKAILSDLKGEMINGK